MYVDIVDNHSQFSLLDMFCMLLTVTVTRFHLGCMRAITFEIRCITNILQTDVSLPAHLHIVWIARLGLIYDSVCSTTGLHLRRLLQTW